MCATIVRQQASLDQPISLTTKVSKRPLIPQHTLLISPTIVRCWLAIMRPGPWSPWRNLSHYQRRLNANIASSSTALIKVTNIPAPHTGLIRILSLNRPSARNAISRGLLTELSQHIHKIRDEGEKGPTRAVILASEVDACFCAGADLKVWSSILHSR